VNLTDARYKTKTTLLLVIIVVEVVLITSLAVLCASLGSQAYSDVSFLEISLDGTALQLEDGRKLMEDWDIPVVAQERFLKTFIQSLRTVTSDKDTVTNNVGRVVYRTSGQAYQLVSSYLETNQPLVLSKSKTVEVPYEDIELTNYGNNRWKIVWREIAYDVNLGQMASDKQYEAVVYLSFKTPSGETELKWNPLGIYITYMDSDLLRSYT
jgi:type IV secretory pathway TrbF-like protein